MQSSLAPGLTDLDYDRLFSASKKQPHPHLFTVLSGAHLYGFPSPDSDFDIRGVHILPLDKLLGLDVAVETLEVSRKDADLDLDLVTHDVAKFLKLMLRNNGCVLEQLYSPWVIETTPDHEEIKQLARGCITKIHYHHYAGFAENQWQLFLKEDKKRAKPILYVFRTLFTGIYLMRTGEVECNLSKLNSIFRLSYLDDLISLKKSTTEDAQPSNLDLSFLKNEYLKIKEQLALAFTQTKLPSESSARAGLDDFLLRIRRKTGWQG